MEVKEFIEKCKKDMQKAKTEMLESLNDKNWVTDKYLLLAYKITMFDEILNMFMANKGGVGFYVKIYGNLENPLEKIFDDMITEFTEPKLVTENKMYKLLDKTSPYIIF